MTTPGIYEWRGKFYHGLASVAAASGTTVQTVGSHLRKHGDLSRLGVGVGRHGNHVIPKANPITVGPRFWPSVRALALEIGVKPKTAQSWIRRGCEDRLLAVVMATDARKTDAALKAAAMVDGPSLDAQRSGGRKGGLLNRRIAA